MVALWLHGAFLLLVVGSEAFFSALSVLNLRHGERTVAAERDWVTGRLGVEDPERLLDYNRAKTGLSLLETWVLLALTLLALYSGLFADAAALVASLSLPSPAEGVVFLLGLVVALRIAALPFDAVDTFVVEEIFDFNQQTPRLWLRDVALGLALTLVLTAVLGGAVLWFVAALPDLWWLAGLGLFVAFSLAMQVVYPRVVAPLFYDFDPVEGTALRDAVDEVFERAGFECEQVYEMDASRRSSHSNAYFVGFGRTKRVVLFDTLVDQMDRPEIQSVLAHELAHWKRHHVWKQLAAGAVEVGVLLVALSALLDAPWLYEMFGVPETAAAGLALAAVWVLPLARLAAPLSNRLSLAHEREADAFAVDVMGDGQPLVDALSVLVGENLGNPFPHPLYATFHYTHPPVPDRIRAIREQAGDEADGDPPGGAGGDASAGA